MYGLDYNAGDSYCITATGQTPFRSPAPFCFPPSSARLFPVSHWPQESSHFLNNWKHAAPQHEHLAPAAAHNWRLVFCAGSEASRPSLHGPSRLLLPFLPQYLGLCPRSGCRYWSHFTHLYISRFDAVWVPHISILIHPIYSQDCSNCHRTGCALDGRWM